MSTLTDELRPLTDQDGQPYKWLPCMDKPEQWDDEAEHIVKKMAAWKCRTICPGRAACYQRMIRTWPKPTGVWAGHIIPGDPEYGQLTIPAADASHDQQIRMWAAEAGIPLPSERNYNR